jgi:aspartyl-tRNA(Asn)/glutamyl-tRNA(Gln) amidotransferase subunit C
MAFSHKDVEYIANLSRIKISGDEKGIFVHQLGDILSYIEKLNTINTDGVQPMAHSIDVSNVFREDTLKPSISRIEAQQTAPSIMGSFFKVPKVIE